jgi:hypothetical protein
LVFQRSYGPKPITTSIGWFSNNFIKNQNGGLIVKVQDIDDELVKTGFQVKSEMTKTLCGVVLPITKQSQKSESCLFKWLQMVWSPVTAPDPDQGFTGVTTF